MRVITDRVVRLRVVVVDSGSGGRFSGGESVDVSSCELEVTSAIVRVNVEVSGVNVSADVWETTGGSSDNEGNSGLSDGVDGGFTDAITGPSETCCLAPF